jgi:hypothetical protein
MSELGDDLNDQVGAGEIPCQKEPVLAHRVDEESVASKGIFEVPHRPAPAAGIFELGLW